MAPKGFRRAADIVQAGALITIIQAHGPLLLRQQEPPDAHLRQDLINSAGQRGREHSQGHCALEIEIDAPSVGEGVPPGGLGDLDRRLGAAQGVAQQAGGGVEEGVHGGLVVLYAVPAAAAQLDRHTHRSGLHMFCFLAARSGEQAYSLAVEQSAEPSAVPARQAADLGAQGEVYGGQSQQDHQHVLDDFYQASAFFSTLHVQAPQSSAPPGQSSRGRPYPPGG